MKYKHSKFKLAELKLVAYPTQIFGMTGMGTTPPQN